tara:strand:- start:101 stop:520 length:420 start_codon:yes stop_codon:yes gene_type:complete
MNDKMKKLLLILIIIPFTVIGQEKDIENKVKKYVKEWINLVDNEKYNLSWEKSDKLVQNLVSIENWKNLMVGSRNPLGKNISRNIISTENKTEIQGAPDGDYYIIVYKSEFENKKNAIETITIKKSEDGSWKVAGYYIK